ncbi:hypothetical protein E4U59_002763 [Claviceps monticola]|nr:hypothetical protein E4U59_002763 [Claviceps monticola]
MQFKADIIELMYEIEASGDPDEFVIPKGEGDGLNCTGHDEGVDLSRLGRDDDPDDCGDSSPWISPLLSQFPVAAPPWVE